MNQIVQYFLLAGIVAVAFIPSLSLAGIILLSLTFCLFLLTLAQKRLSVILLFTFAFAYMIPPEAILSGSSILSQWGDSARVGFRVLLFSFVAVYSGFLFSRKKEPFINQEAKSLRRFDLVNKDFCKWVCLILTFVVTLLCFPMILHGLTTGRGGGLLFDIGVGSYFLMSFMYLICGFWGYYYYLEGKGVLSVLKALILSSPMFLIGVASGTRFYLCFMFLLVLTPWIYHLSARKIKWVAVSCALVMVLFSAMKMSRAEGFDLRAAFVGTSTHEGLGITEKIASVGSPEGLVHCMAMIDDYTTKKSYTYGKSVGFLVIFWIPRFLWEDKPAHMGHWLIREYYTKGFGESHSTSASFCGELFLDFGYLCIAFCFVLGVVMAKIDAYISNHLSSRSFFSTVLSGALLGWSLFMTRSFVTASQGIVLLLPVLYLFSKFVVKEKLVVSRRLNNGNQIIRFKTR